MINSSSNLYTNSLATKNLLNSYFHNSIRKDVNIFYPLIDTDDISTLSTIKFQEIEKSLDITLDQKIIVVSVCRLVKRKGIDLAVKAINIASKRIDNLIYLIIGDGPEKSNIKFLVKNLHLDNEVKLIGRVSDELKFSILKFSKIFLMPNHSNSYNDFEGFGISFIEASYQENVVIGGLNGGAVESVIDNETGFLFDFEKSEKSQIIKLSKKINELCFDPLMIQSISQTGKKYITEKFSINKTVQEF